MNVPSLRIEQAIIHEITERTYAPPAPPQLITSNAVSHLDDDLRSYFEQRVADSLRLAAFAVVADPDRTSPAPESDTSIWRARVAISSRSQRRWPHTCSKLNRPCRSSSALVISSGQLDSGACLAVLKLKRQEGLHLERTGSVGAESYSLEHLAVPMLTNHTRVFKVALFEADGMVDPDDVHGLVSDKQRFSSPEKRMADFFLSDFLGVGFATTRPNRQANIWFAQRSSSMSTSPAQSAEPATTAALPQPTTSQQPGRRPRSPNSISTKATGRLSSPFSGPEDIPVADFAKDTTLVAKRLEQSEYDPPERNPCTRDPSSL